MEALYGIGALLLGLAIVLCCLSQLWVGLCSAFTFRQLAPNLRGNKPFPRNSVPDKKCNIVVSSENVERTKVSTVDSAVQVNIPQPDTLSVKTSSIYAPISVTVEPDTHTHLSSDAHYVKVPCSEQIINIIESPYCEVDVINETERYSASQNIERESKPYKRQNNYSSFFRF